MIKGSGVKLIKKLCEEIRYDWKLYSVNVQLHGTIIVVENYSWNLKTKDKSQIGFLDTCR